MSSQRHLSTRGGGQAPGAGETDDRGAHCIMCGCVVQPTPGEMTPAHGWHCDRCARDKLRRLGFRVEAQHRRPAWMLAQLEPGVLSAVHADGLDSLIEQAEAELGR